MEKINCLIVDDEPTAREILITHLSKLEHVHVVQTCKNALEAMHVLKEHSVDLILLDINMPEIDGLSFKRIIGEDTKVIFTTAHREYALEGFELNAVDYLLKPITFERLVKALEKYEKPISHAASSSAKGHFFVRSDRKMIRIDFDEIRYVESFSDYVKIHLKDRVVVTRELISRLEEVLSESFFLRIHRSYIVAIDQISAYTNEFVEVGGKQLVISRSYKEKVFKRLNG